MRSGIFRFNGLKIHYRPQTADEVVIDYTLKKNIFLSRLPEYRIKSEHIVIDVGSHIGTFSILISEKVKNGKVFAIEPCKDSFEYLSRNVAQNRLHNVIPIHLALSDCDGVAKLYHDLEGGNFGHSITKKRSDQWEEVTCKSLKSFLESVNIEKCDLLRLNCEGAEFKIILNTPVEILKKVNLALILFHTHLENQYSLIEMVTHLKNAGYQVTIRHRHEGHGWLVAQRWTWENATRLIWVRILLLWRRVVARTTKEFNSLLSQ